jgi:hypothetical protein
MTSKEYMDKFCQDKKSPKKKINHPEYELQKQLCTYLRTCYPKVMFLSDTVANVKLTIPQQVRNKAIQCSDFHCPDLLILEPTKKHHFLAIELKSEIPFKKDGSIKASTNDHLRKQLRTINTLSYSGVYACFCWEFTQAKLIIDSYLHETL